MKMHLLNVPITVIIDDYLPLFPHWDGTLTTQFAKVGSDGALWGTLIEKAFAKYLMNYEATIAGHGAHGIETMTGSPYTSWIHKNVMSDNTEETLW